MCETYKEHNICRTHFSQCPASKEVGYSIHHNIALHRMLTSLQVRIFAKFCIIINAVLVSILFIPAGLLAGKRLSLGWVGCDRSAGGKKKESRARGSSWRRLHGQWYLAEFDPVLVAAAAVNLVIVPLRSQH